MFLVIYFALFTLEPLTIRATAVSTADQDKLFTLPYGFGIFRHNGLWYPILSSSWDCGLTRSIRIRYGVYDVGPVCVQSCLEAVQRGCTNHLGGESIPVVHDSGGKGRPPHPRGCWKLLDFKLMSPSNSSSQSEE